MEKIAVTRDGGAERPVKRKRADDEGEVGGRSRAAGKRPRNDAPKETSGRPDSRARPEDGAARSDRKGRGKDQDRGKGKDRAGRGGKKSETVQAAVKVASDVGGEREKRGLEKSGAILGNMIGRKRRERRAGK